MKSNEGHQESHSDRPTGHDLLYLKLSVLFAGWEPEGEPTTAQEYFISQILYRAYRFVIELRQMKEGYEKMKKREESENNLRKLLDSMKDKSGPGVDLSRIQLKALLSQVRVTAPYISRINAQENGVFNNLDDFLDVGNGLKALHLKKSDKLLPDIFLNLTKRTNIKELLSQDLKQTQRNYEQAKQEAERKMNAVENVQQFHRTLFSRLEKELAEL